MAGETDVKAEPVQAPTAPAATPPDPEPVRPIAPEILALLKRGRAIQEMMGTVRGELAEVVSGLVIRYPQHLKQIAEVLDGEAQRLLKLHHDEQQEARRNGSR